jgi:pimeloyl-ACP methyl ester carboxylesterase
MQKQIITSDNVNINYNIERKSDLYLVFVHGLGGDLNLWSVETRFFSKKGYSTISVDLRGHGLSGRPKLINQYSIDRFAKDIYEVLKHEKIKKCILIGHCFGGAVLIKFNELYPLLGDSYVLIDTTYKSTKLMRLLKIDTLLSNIINHILKLISVRRKNFYHVDFRKHIGTGNWNIKRIFNDMRSVGIKSYIFTFENFAEFDASSSLKNFKKPVLIIEGEKDSVFNLKIAHEMNSLIKDSTLIVIPKANHQVTLNNIVELQKIIYNYINDLNSKE